MRRNGSGTGLVDPVPLPDLSVIQDAIADAEWVLHAANQDLPCLAEIGLVPDADLRHRARRPAGRPPAGRPRRRRRVAARLLAAEGPLRRRLEHPAAARGVAGLRRARRRGARRPARRAGRHPRGAGQERLGPAGVRGDPRRRPAGARRPTRGGARPGCTACAAAVSWACSASLWEARDDMARRRDIAPGPGAARLRDGGRRAGRPGERGRAARAAGLPRPCQPPARGHLVRRARPRPRRPGGRAAPAQPAGRGAAAGQPVGRPRPGRGHPAAGRPRGAGRDLGEALRAGGERALPRPGPPDHVEPARSRARPRRSPRRCGPAARASGRSS